MALYIEDVEKKLIESIKSADFKQVDQNVAVFFDQLRRAPMDDIQYGMWYLMSVVYKTVREVNLVIMQPLLLDFNALSWVIQENETINDWLEGFSDILSTLLEAWKGSDTEKKRTLTAAIRQKLVERFHDSGMSLTLLADEWKMNPKYISKVFRDVEGKMIPEFVNEVRLKEAELLLQMTTYTIKDIAERASYTSETYFSTVFKKKHGITPMN